MLDSTRFKGSEWFSKKADILQIGLGGIGNPTAMRLLLCNNELIVYEHDTVESHNCIPQGYFRSSINFSKTAAFRNQFYQMFNVNPKMVTLGKYETDSLTKPITIVAVDNMATRKLAFDKWKQQPNRELFIDGRLLAEAFQLFIVKKGDEERYESSLFSDDDVLPTLCTYQQTKHVADILAGYITQMVCNYQIDVPTPFKIEYFGILSLLNEITW